MVWSRNGVSATECPRSYVTAESVAWLERFAVWRRFGGPGVEGMSAREGEAMSVLLDEERRGTAAFTAEAQRFRRDSAEKNIGYERGV